MTDLHALAGYAPYVVAITALWALFGVGRHLAERRAAARHRQANESGEPEPVSLHPLIDPAKCVGCGACTHACPEGKIIDMIGGKAQLVDPLSCIGHGACKAACPTGAIELVFGSARRGVDIPVVSPAFESSVPGIFIAGELGGMGLIANAIEQGRQAVEAIARDLPRDDGALLDIVIVGGGPAGIAATLAAKEKGLRTLTLEQDTLGGTVAHYPRGKIAMTRPAMLPLFGKVRLGRVRKERLLALWHSVINKTGIEIQQGVRVERITALALRPDTDPGFEVATSLGRVRTRRVLLATGRRGAPRKLGIPGEDLAKVAYTLADVRAYADQHVLVIGGGDSALEAAIALARGPAASITLAYRGTTFNRARPQNRERFEQARAAGRIRFLPETQVVSIAPAQVVLDQRGRHHSLTNDAVIICAGGVLPTALLANAGIRVERKFGTA